MTVSQFEQDVLWEPETPPRRWRDAIASFRVDGLELDEFGAALMQRIADEEIDEDEAIAIAARCTTGSERRPLPRSAHRSLP